ncbi:hypothetical protein N431DRAFT_425695 [Stipitochalara longipes BDJ]|nr:hypothetical protein N431DRAFT_425695 [Stipitochalara longipes BDJ]
MPRAKRPLAEADPNASRHASSAKASKTGTGRIRKTADGHIPQGDSEELSSLTKHNATRNKSSGTAIASSSPKPPNSTSQEPADPKPNFAADSRYRLHLPGSTYLSSVNNDGTNGVHKDQGSATGSRSMENESTIQMPVINYKTKDNSKLRALLADRCLPTSGSRNELISRLEKSKFDYDTYSSEQIVELLKERGLRNTSLGSKEVKIQRLLLNDSLDRDTSNYEDMKLYVKAEVSLFILKDLVAKQEAMLTGEDRSYSTSTWTIGKLGALLEDRKLASSGTKEEMIARLRANDRKKLAKDILDARERYHSAKKQLEAEIGHPIEDPDLTRIENPVNALDNQLQAQGQLSRPGKPICDYDWRDSHWASKTERELWDICHRRGMPGRGPRAASLKWLDTGSVEYEDLYAGSLEMICFRRGIKHRSGEKKVDLIRRLKEADEQEESAD